MLDDELMTIASTVVDGGAVDWDSMSGVTAQDRRLLDGLRLIAELHPEVRSHREAPSSGDITLTRLPFEWGPLKVLQRLGVGRFGEVFLAWDETLARNVALKILHFSRTGANRQAHAIVDEGRLLAKVRHPNVVTVYGAQIVDGRVGIWMEFINGCTLQDEVAAGRSFTADEVVRLGVELCSALAAVHAAGVLHRDVKPQNIMQSRDGRVLLTDFGADCEIAHKEHSVALVGTPLFAAPEVINGADANPQSDIYSLGVVLFYLLSTRYPVSGGTLEDVRDAHGRSDRRYLAKLRKDVPGDVCRVIERAISPRPDERYADASAFSRDLEALGAAQFARRKARNLKGLIATAALLVLAGSVYLSRTRHQQVPAIAVLPLKSLSGATHGQEIADGLTDEITRELAMIQGLEVRSRTSASMLANDLDVRAIGQQLAVGLVLEGTVLRVDDHVRVNARLVRVSDDVAVWSGHFDREMKDAILLQDDVSRSLVNQLRLQVVPGIRKYDADPDAYEHYLRAKALNDRKDGLSVQSAIELFKYVIARDPDFAPAYAGLAWAYADLSVNRPTREGYDSINVAATKAFQLDPKLPEAYAAMGVAHSWRREWKEADQAFARAIALNSSLSWARVGYAYWDLMQVGRFDEALQQLREAQNSDPLSLDVRRVKTMVEVYARRYGDAIVDAEYVLQRDPQMPQVPAYYLRALWLSGNVARARDFARERGTDATIQTLVTVLSGDVKGTARIFQSSSSSVVKLQTAAVLGQKDLCFRLLRNMAADNDPRVGSLLLLPEVASNLEDDPRYASLLQELRR